MWAFRRQRQEPAHNAEWNRSRQAAESEAQSRRMANICQPHAQLHAGATRPHCTRSKSVRLQWLGNCGPPKPSRCPTADLNDCPVTCGGAQTSTNSRPLQALEALHPCQDRMGRRRKHLTRQSPVSLSRAWAPALGITCFASVKLGLYPCGITDLGVKTDRKASRGRLHLPKNLSYRCQ
jgi:hypothetical protein